MAELLTPDLCIIGGGPAGRAAAITAVAYGIAVVLVDRNRLGTEGERAGSLPIGALAAAGRRMRLIAEAPAFGVTVDGAGIDFTRVRGHVLGTVAALAPNASRERLAGLGVQVVEGVAAFKDRKTVLVGEAFEIRARHYIVATGALPALPSLPGLEDTPYLTEQTVFDLVQCPEHLIVIGATATGLELAQAFRRLGAAVTVLDSGEPLWREDAECVRVVLDRLVREGVTIRSGAVLNRTDRVQDKVMVFLGENGDEMIEGSHLLMATGRRPNIADLRLEKARIRHDRWGVVVDQALRTSNERVLAIGDVAGGLQYTHAGRYHASLAVQNALFERSLKVRAAMIPRVTFTDPELAQIGLNEEEARQAGHAYRVLRWPVRDNDRAVAVREMGGHIKVVVRPNGRILGVTFVGEGAGELIAPWCLAMREGLPVDAMAGTILPYPTFGEVGSQAAMAYVIPSPPRAWLRRMIRALRRTG